MKAVIIGAGSGFGSRLSVDILSREPLQASTIALCDIDAKKLETVQAYVQKVIDGNKLPAAVTASTDRKEVLRDADFVVIAVSIGGPAYYGKPYEFEMGIPKKYGITQTVGDTVGAGGVFRALRTGPELLAMAEDISRLAPNAMILNYTNPMAILTWVLNARAGVPAVGLCHSVQGTSKFLADCIGVPYPEVGYWVAGINHMAWVLKYTHKGKDAYPLIFKAAKKPEIFARQPIRFEIMQEFGYFVTESSRHMSEYVPWYQHEQDVMQSFVKTTKGVKERRQAWFEDMGVKASQAESIALHRSHEYASGIMEAVVTNAPMRFNGNVLNHGLISNLPAGCCVEVPCLTDREGVHPCQVGDLPPPCAAMCRANVAVQELTVKAILERDRNAAYHAVLLDPSVGAVLTLKQARRMFEEMWRREGSLLDAYKTRLRRSA
ncbi:MAG: alpha-galactosidase [Kiritimatiellae bacterium]|nr:alpha-galactosidase [Kiritimatiellia bacterium]